MTRVCPYATQGSLALCQVRIRVGRPPAGPANRVTARSYNQAITHNIFVYTLTSYILLFLDKIPTQSSSRKNLAAEANVYQG
jgi:hypothetical protein